MGHFKNHAAGLIAIAIAGWLSTPLQAAPFFLGLGDLPGGSVDILAAPLGNAISRDGAVVVSRGNSDNGFETFRWTQAGGLQGLGDIAGGDFFSQPNATSADGAAVVGAPLGAATS